MVEKVQSIRNKMKTDYNGFILIHIKALHRPKSKYFSKSKPK